MSRTDRPESAPTRRQLLATIGTGTAMGTAGCSAILGGDGDDGAADAGSVDDSDGGANASDGSTDAEGSDGDDGTWTEGGPPDREEWTVTFQDDFAAGALDRSVWRNGFGFYPLDCPHHDGPNHCAVEEYAYVEDGRLVTEASETTPEIPPAEDSDDREDQPEFSVGAVHTEGVFEQEFGYFEVKSKIPAEPGTLPACWFYIDISEHDWREPHVYEARGIDAGESIEMGANWWYDDWELRSVGAHSWDDGTVEVDPPTHETFHVYAVEWGPDSLTWYVDGEQVGRSEHPETAEHLAGEPVYWVLNHGVFEAGDWVGDPADAAFPSYHEFEWVRAWQHDDWR